MRQPALGVAPARRDSVARKEGAIEIVYCSFSHAAQLEDEGERARAAGWRTLGMVTCALISTEREARNRAAACPFQGKRGSGEALRSFETECSSIVYQMEQLVERVRRELSLLAEAGTKGGSLTAGTARWFADTLWGEFDELRKQLSRLSDEISSRL